MSHIFKTSQFVLVGLSLSLLPGCDQEQNSRGPQPTGTTAPRAQDVGYDNVGSRLSDRTVQGAIDELAARVDSVPDPHGRVEVVQSSLKSTADSVGWVVSVNCPGGGEVPFGRALGGSCSDDMDGGEISVRRSELGTNGFTCHWNKKPGEVTFTATVTCLMPAK